MFWIIPAWAISLVASFLLGRYLTGLTKRITQLEKAVQSKVDKKPEPEKPVSTFIDVTDPVQEAIWERAQLMKKLNPDE